MEDRHTKLELLEEKVRRKARKDFLSYCYLLSDEPAPVRHHRLLIEALQKAAEGELKRIMVFMPPGCAKSTYASILFPSWYIGHTKDKLIISASHTQDLSDHFGRKVRAQVRQEEYREVFDIEISQDSSAASRWDIQDHKGGYYSVGVQGNVTGRRGDLLVIDDPVKGREDADSETVREKTWNSYLSDLRTRLKPNGIIIIVQTRWHEDDLSGRILPEDYNGESGLITAKDGEEWYVISLPMEAEENDILGRDIGELLWPQWFTPEIVRQEKATQTLTGQRNWSALYQQRPSPEEGEFFKKEWIQFYDELPMNMRKYGASDYAVTEGGGDFTVHGVAATDYEDNLYIIDWWRKQTDSLVWIEAFLDMAQTHKPLEWAEEKGQIIKSLDPIIDKRIRERRIDLYRRQYASSADKPTRAQSIRARFAQKKVYLPRKAEWVEKLVSELLKFPAGKYDDQVDVMSLFGRILSRMSAADVEPPKDKQDALSIREMIQHRAKQNEHK